MRNIDKVAGIVNKSISDGIGIFITIITEDDFGVNKAIETYFGKNSF